MMVEFQCNGCKYLANNIFFFKYENVAIFLRMRKHKNYFLKSLTEERQPNKICVSTDRITFKNPDKLCKSPRFW